MDIKIVFVGITLLAGIFFLIWKLCGCKESFNESCVASCNNTWSSCNKNNGDNCGKRHTECLLKCNP